MYIKTTNYDSLKKELPSLKVNNLNGIIVSSEKVKVKTKDISPNTIINNEDIIYENNNLNFFIDDESIILKEVDDNEDFLYYYKCYCTRCNHLYEVLDKQDINLRNAPLKKSIRLNYTKIKNIHYIDNNGQKKLNSNFKYDFFSCPKCNGSTLYFDVSIFEKVVTEIDSLYIVNTENEFRISFYGKNHHIFETIKEDNFDKDYIFFNEIESEESIQRSKEFMKGKTVHSSFYNNRNKNNATVYLSKTNYRYSFIYKKKTNKLILQSDKSFHNIKFSIYGEYVLNSLVNSLLMFVSDKEIVDIIYSLFEEIMDKTPLYQRKKLEKVNYLSEIKNQLEGNYNALKDMYGNYNLLNNYNSIDKFMILFYSLQYPFYFNFINDFDIKINTLKEDLTPYYFKKIYKEANNTDDVLKILFPSMNKKLIKEYKSINKKGKEDNLCKNDTLNIIAHLVLSSNNKGFVERELLSDNKKLLRHLKWSHSLYGDNGEPLNRQKIRSILKYFNFEIEDFIKLIKNISSNRNVDINDDDFLEQEEYDYYLFVDTIDMMFQIRKKIKYLKNIKSTMNKESLHIFNDNLKHFKFFLKSKKHSFIEFHNQLMKFDISFSKNSHVVYDNYLDEDREKEFKMNDYSLELPKTYMELADSAIKMHICAASYTERIEDRESVLYYIYQDSKPIVCIEYNPKEKKVIQIKKSFNKLINQKSSEDDSLLAFIKKWKIKKSIDFKTNDLKI